MNLIEALEQIRQKWQLRADSLDESGWKTIKGTHVLIDDGEVSYGPERLRSWNKTRRETARQGGAAQPKKTGARACTSSDELRHHIRSIYNIDTTGLDSFMDTEHGFKVIQEVFGSVDDVVQQYPELHGFFNALLPATGSTLMACSFLGGFKVNSKTFGTPESTQKQLDSINAEGWNPPNTTLASIAAHECGHALVNLIIEKETGYPRVMPTDGDSRYYDEWSSRRVHKEIISKAIQRFQRTPEGRGKRAPDIRDGMTGYTRDVRKKRDGCTVL